MHNDSLGCLFPLGFFTLFIGIAVVVGYFDKKATNEAWGKFAQSAGLNLIPGGFMTTPRVAGSYKGLDFSLYIFTRGSGKNSTTYTGIIMGLPRTGNFNLHVYPEGFLSKIGKALGSQDIQIDDREFDAAFMIKSNTPEKVLQVLTPELRRQMLQGRNMIDISVNTTSVSYEKIGTMRNINDLNYISEIMWQMAQNVPGETGYTEPARQISDAYSYQTPPVSQEAPSGNEQSGFATYGSSSSVSDFQTAGGDVTCSSCGATVPPNNKYCINCGKKV